MDGEDPDVYSLCHAAEDLQLNSMADTIFGVVSVHEAWRVMAWLGKNSLS